MAFEHVRIRNYDAQIDRAKVEDLQRRCEVGPSDHALLYTDTMGDPICRIRNSPIYIMLVAEVDNEIVGIIQGTIKVVRLHKPSKDLAKVGYILGLRVSPRHRRNGIGSILVQRLEDWFSTNQADLAYMATEKDNKASVRLFVNKFGYIKFRTPAILVHPWNSGSFHSQPDIEITKLSIEQAEFVYQNIKGSFEFFPHDIEKILRNKLSLGTWVAYYKNELSCIKFGVDGKVPNSFAMVSVWNSGGVFKLRLGKAPLFCGLYAKISRLMGRVLGWFNVPTLPDFFNPFGFYFMYGVHQQGPSTGKLVSTLCNFVHKLAKESSQDCKMVVTEIGDYQTLKPHIPHWRCLSCPEDLWCVKPLTNEVKKTVYELMITTTPTTKRALFVDPREV